MNVEEIKEVMSCFDASASLYMEVKQGDLSLVLKKAGAEYITGEASDKRHLQLQQAAFTTGNQKSNNGSQNPAGFESQNEAKQAAASKKLEPGTQVKAPMVGVFYAAASPEKEAYVQVGSQVKKGQVLCLIEAMKMMSEITAPCDGRIETIYVKNADMVEFDQPLFLIGE